MNNKSITHKSNKVITVKDNYLLPYRNIYPNYFDDGGFWDNPFKGDNGKKTLQGLGTAAIGAVGNIAGDLIGGDLTTPADKAIKGLSGIAGAIPGPWGAVASAGLGLIGGLAKRAFGSKMNDANISSINNNITALNNAQSSAGSFDELSNLMATSPSAMTFNNSFVGKDGWFSNKAKNKANELRAEQANAVARQEQALYNNASNLNENQLFNMEANYAAFGGELGTNGADFTSGLLHVNSGGTHEDNGIGGIPISIDKDGNPNLVEEGETIYNNYVFSNRLEVPDDFKTRYKLRGKKDLTFADASKKMSKESEERPNDPISKNGLESMLMALAGEQERVKAEEQLKLLKKLAKKGITPDSLVEDNNPNPEDNNTNPNPNVYAGGGIMDNPPANQGLEYMPQSTPMVYDPLSNFYVDSIIPKIRPIPVTPQLRPESSAYTNISPTIQNIEVPSVPVQAVQPTKKTKPWVPSKINNYGYIKNGYYGYGEPFWIKDGKYTQDYIDLINNNYSVDDARQHFIDQFNFYDNATAEDKKTNRYKAIKYFIDRNPEWYKHRSNINDWDISDDLFNQVRQLALSNPGFMHPEKYAQTHLKDPKLEHIPASPIESIAGGIGAVLDKINRGELKVPTQKADEIPDDTEYKKLPTWMRYIPTVGLGIGVLTDALGLTNKPDYSNADAILEASKNGRYMPIEYRPIGNYLEYNPFDRDFYTNKLNAQAEANRRAVNQNAGLNRGAGMAALLASDYNAQSKLGDLARQAEEFNLAQRQMVEGFNRDTNKTNSQGFLQADMANQNAYMHSADSSLNAKMQAAQMRERAKLLADQGKAANLSGLLTSLGNIGNENMAWNWRNFGMSSGTYGPINEELVRLLGYTLGNDTDGRGKRNNESKKK